MMYSCGRLGEIGCRKIDLIRSELEAGCQLDLLTAEFSLLAFAELIIQNKTLLVDDPWERFDFEAIAVDTGIEDFAANHDHYLYGAPKTRMKAADIQAA